MIEIGIVLIVVLLLLYPRVFLLAFNSIPSMLNFFLWNTFADSLPERWTWNPSTDGKWSLVSILSRRPLMVQLEAWSGMMALQHRPLGYTSVVSSNERATYWIWSLSFSDSFIEPFFDSRTLNLRKHPRTFLKMLRKKACKSMNI